MKDIYKILGVFFVMFLGNLLIRRFGSLGLMLLVGAVILGGLIIVLIPTKETPKNQ